MGYEDYSKYESIRDISSDVYGAYYRTSTRQRTPEQTKVYERWQARSNEKKQKSDRYGELVDAKIEALRKGNYREVAKIERQMRELAKVPTNRQELEEDYRQVRADRELALSALCGYSEDEASQVYDRITNCREMKKAKSEIDAGVDRFIRRMMS